MKQKVSMLVLLLGLCTGMSAAQTVPARTQQAIGSSPNSGGKPLTLQEAEAIALQKNPQITVGKLRALQAHEFVREARSALLPTASLNLTGVESRAGSRIAAGYLNNPVIYPRAAVGASVSQLITDFGRTNNLVSSSEFQAKA